MVVENFKFCFSPSNTFCCNYSLLELSYLNFINVHYYIIIIIVKLIYRINFVFYKSGMWVYPILTKLNLPLRVMFFTGTFLYAPFTYLFGEYFNNTYWGIRSSNVSLYQIYIFKKLWSWYNFINNNINY